MEVEKRFAAVYRAASWSGKKHDPLSGPGSRIHACPALAAWIEKNKPAKILDLGCGDLTWLAEINAIQSGAVHYTGVDAVPTLIAHHRRVFPWFSGFAADIATLSGEDGADMILLKDVLFHLQSEECERILCLVASWNHWRYLAVTTNPSASFDRGTPSGPMMKPFEVEKTSANLGTIIERFPRHDGGVVALYARY